MPWICLDCGAVFDEPEHVNTSFDHAFGTQPAETLTCPECQEGVVEQAVPCGDPNCYGFMKQGRHLCRDCREDLLQRVRNFFDTLTAEEEAVFDEWMDGASITDRNQWEA